jgi:hypothetical protein
MDYAHLLYDGNRSFDRVIQAAGLTKAQLLAKFTLFSLPQVVAESKNKAVFRIIRDPERRGEYDDDQRVFLDDNTTPKDLFIKANALGVKTKNLGNHFNHIYRLSGYVEYYTSLANICMTPSFISRLTDSDEECKAILRYRSYRLYGNFFPEGFHEPHKPDGYDQLEELWPKPKKIVGLREVVTKWLDKAKKSRAALSAQRYGWLFSE